MESGAPLQGKVGGGGPYPSNNFGHRCNFGNNIEGENQISCTKPIDPGTGGGAAGALAPPTLEPGGAPPLKH